MLGRYMSLFFIDKYLLFIQELILNCFQLVIPPTTYLHTLPDFQNVKIYICGGGDGYWTQLTKIPESKVETSINILG